LFRFAKVPVLRCNIGSFGVQNRHFYNAKQWVLQSVVGQMVTRVRLFYKFFAFLWRWKGAYRVGGANGFDALSAYLPTFKTKQITLPNILPNDYLIWLFRCCIFANVNEQGV